jgi:hypothetical protein
VAQALAIRGELMGNARTVNVGQVVSDYIDIINEHGIGSPEAKDFRGENPDGELTELFDAADDVKERAMRGEFA